MGYYMGDYYAGARGDPGFLGSLFNIGKSALGLIPGVGGIAKAGLEKITAGRAATAGGAIVKRVGGTIARHPVLSAAGAAGVGVLGGAGVEKMIHGRGKCRHVNPRTGKCIRRMHVTNPRALRRALRRAHGFANFAMKCIRLTHPKKHGSFGGFKLKGKKKGVC